MCLSVEAQVVDLLIDAGVAHFSSSRIGQPQPNMHPRRLEARAARMAGEGSGHSHKYARTHTHKLQDKSPLPVWLGSLSKKR
jgi:hypothetical protein